MSSSRTERRKHPRTRKPSSHTLKIVWNDRTGAPRVVVARLIDTSDGGLGVETAVPVAVGSIVTVTGHPEANASGPEVQGRARVAACLLDGGGACRIGLSFEGLGQRNPFFAQHKQKQAPSSGPVSGESFLDYYEVMQLSPTADPETIHRVYRMFAQRYHPDNRDTGNEEAFKQLLKAYRVLSDPEQRAAYETEHRAVRKLRWKVFDQPKAAQGRDAEKRKRRAIISLLYTKRLGQPDHPWMNIMEMAELLECQRDSLEFCLWYLRENGWITRSDNGQYLITAKGVDGAEECGVWQPQTERLLRAAETSSSPDPDAAWDRMEHKTVRTA